MFAINQLQTMESLHLWKNSENKTDFVSHPSNSSFLLNDPHVML